MQGDLHGTRIRARAAERRGMRQRRRLAQPDEQRQQHCAHWPRVHRPVRRAAALAIHRAHVQAGAAADTRQHLAVAAAKQVRPPVVEDDDMHLLRPVGLPLAARPREERRVDRELLPRGRPRKQAQQHGQVGGRRHQPLHPHDRHMHARDRRDEPRVAFVRDRQISRSKRPEVRAGDPTSAFRNVSRSCVRAALSAPRARGDPLPGRRSSSATCSAVFSIAAR